MKNQLKKFITRVKQTIIKEWGVVFGFSLAVALIDPFATSMKRAFGSESRNIDSMFASDLFIPVGLALGLAALTATIFVAVFRRNRVAALISSLLFVAACWDFQGRFFQQLPNLKTFVPVAFESNLPYSVIFAVLMALIYGLIGYFLSKYLAKIPRVYSKLPALLITMVLFVLFFNSQGVIVFLFQTREQRNFRPSPISATQRVSANSELPDIYYIVLDRHSNNEVLNQQLGFDNSAFSESLRQQNYYVNDSAYAAYPYTAMSVGSTMSATYLDQIEKQYASSKNQTHALLFNLTRYGSVPAELKKIGYEYNVIGSWYGVSNKAPLADNFYYEHVKLQLAGQRKYVNEIDKYSLNKSIFSETLRKTENLTTLSDADQSRYQLGKLNDIASSDDVGGRFVFAHLLLPHPPYVFNADGSQSSYDPGDNSNGASVKQKYLNQLQYIDSEINKLSQKILEKTNNKAIIVLQSDEGYYPHFMLEPQIDINQVFKEMMNSDMTKWSDEYLKAKFGILAAYHLPGVPSSEIAKGANSANIFRLILNNYFGYDLEYLPDCNFALNEGRARALSYTDITARLSNNPNPACQTIHD